MSASAPNQQARVQEELRKQIAEALWSIGVHCEIGRMYAELGADDRLSIALEDAFACLDAALSCKNALWRARLRETEEGGRG